MDDNNIDNGENHPVQESEQEQIAASNDRATATELAASARLRLMSCLQEYDDYPQQTRSKTDELVDEYLEELLEFADIHDWVCKFCDDEDVHDSDSNSDISSESSDSDSGDKQSLSEEEQIAAAADTERKRKARLELMWVLQGYGGFTLQTRSKTDELVLTFLTEIQTDIAAVVTKETVVKDSNMLMLIEQTIIHIMKFIPNRTDWNSVACCNTNIYKLSKEIMLPPWPYNFKLRVPADYGLDQRYVFKKMRVNEQIIIRILEFIPNRTIWNSVARCNKNIYNLSKEMLLPPWPYNFKLGGVAPNYRISRPAWSPDGTQIACCFASKIIIFDQRHGLLRFRHNGDNNGNNNNNNSNIMTPFLTLQMFAHDLIHNPTDIHLIYSPDGSLLVALTAGLDLRVKICVYTTDGYYRQLQEWNLHAYWEGGWYTDLHIDISPCSKYVVVIVDNQILLKDVNNGETIKSIVIAEHHIRKVMFCKNDDQCSIFIHLKDNETKKISLKIWFPYDNIDDEDEDDTTASLITVLEPQSPCGTFVLSHDNSMIVYRKQESIRRPRYDDVMLYSIDNDTKSATFKQSFRRLARRSPSIYFTPDDKYILYTKNRKLAFFNGRDITDPIKTTYNTEQSRLVWDHPQGCALPFVYFSPAGGTIRRFLVRDNTDKFFYIASYWER